MSDESLVSLVHKFYLLQEERAHVYKLFEEGHKIYLNTAPNYDFPKFRVLVHDVTQEFKRISIDIMAIEQKIRIKGYPKLAQIIVELQEDEKLKLELSAKLQMAKQDIIDNPDLDDQWRNHVKHIKEQLRNTVNRINEGLESTRYQIEDLDA